MGLKSPQLRQATISSPAPALNRVAIFSPRQAKPERSSQRSQNGCGKDRGGRERVRGGEQDESNHESTKGRKHEKDNFVLSTFRAFVIDSRLTQPTGNYYGPPIRGTVVQSNRSRDRRSQDAWSWLHREHLPKSDGGCVNEPRNPV